MWAVTAGGNKPELQMTSSESHVVVELLMTSITFITLFVFIETCLSLLQTSTQLDSTGSGHVDIKYEDYAFTPTAMAPQNSWCALSQA